MKWHNLHTQFLSWRKDHINDKQFIMILSSIIGLLVGIAAVIIKNLVFHLSSLLERVAENTGQYMFIVFPIIGIALVYLFITYILKKPIGPGIPSVLYAISKHKGKIPKSSLYSSIVASTLTVSFGGSVGLESPTVATSAAIGSNAGKLLNLNYKQIILLLGCACSAAMAAIFKAPIAAIVFALEVIMLDLTLAAIVPLLIASVISVLTSYFFMGQNVLYAIDLVEKFTISQVPFYILFGVFTGFLSVYFTKTFLGVTAYFEGIKKRRLRILIGGISLGVLVFLMPSLFGEGYEVINKVLAGDISHLFEDTIYEGLTHTISFTLLIFALLIIFKVLATSITIGAGGVGGVFAPSLFLGSHAGLMFAYVLGLFGMNVSSTNYASVGMAGLIAGVIHAPLTSIFLIAEITGGHELFVPLMIVSTISFATARLFTKNSVYTAQLAKRGELLTHDKDQTVLTLLSIKEVIETDLKTIHPGATLKDLIPLISSSNRNIFPVVNADRKFMGVLSLEGDLRKDVFDHDKLEAKIEEYMIQPKEYACTSDSMEVVMKKFSATSYYNMPVIDNGKYMGFVSRSNTFSAYRKVLLEVSQD